MRTIQKLTIRLTRELNEEVKKAARESGLSINQFIISILNDRLSSSDGKSPEDPVEKISPDDHQGVVTYRFPSNYAAIIRGKANILGLTDTAYLRKLILTKTFKHIDYSTDDLRDYLSQSQRLIDSVRSFVDLIYIGGKGDVFDQDVHQILSMLDEIRTLEKKQVELALSNRQNVYRKMIKRVEEELKTAEQTEHS